MKLSKIVLSLVMLVSLTAMSLPAFAAYDSYFKGVNGATTNGYYYQSSSQSMVTTFGFNPDGGTPLPATALKIDGKAVDQYPDGSIELAYVFWDDTENRWVNCGSEFVMKRDDNSGDMASLSISIEKDDDRITGIDGYPDVKKINGVWVEHDVIMHAYDHVAEKLYTITDFIMHDEFGNRVLETFQFDGGISYYSFQSFNAYGAANAVVPADDAVAQATTITLEWTNLDDVATKYEVYFGTAENNLALVATFNDPANDGHEHPLANTLNAGTEYFWRVDATLEGKVVEGEVASFWTKLETPEITSPANNAINLNPVNALEVAFNTVGTDCSYTVKVMQGEDTYTTTGTTSPITVKDGEGNLVLNYCTEYTATVTANHDASGNYSDESAIVTFTTIPDAVTLGQPTGNDIAVANPTFNWTNDPANTCADSYNFELKKGEAVAVSRTGLTATNVTLTGVTLDPYAEYTWTVAAVNTAGDAGLVSTPANFRTEMVWDATDLYPADNAIQIPTSPEFDWADIAGGTTYDITINGVTTTGLTESKFQYAGTFGFEERVTWSVIAYNSDKSENVMSGDLEFTAKMDTPNLDFPANNETCVELAGSLRWLDFGATSYTLEFKKENEAWTSATTTTLSDTIWNYSGTYFERATTYEWRVKALKNGIETDYSEVRTFTTVNVPLTLNLPADNEKGLDLDVPVSITAPIFHDANVEYTFELSTNNFTTVAETLKVKDALTVTFTNLSEGTMYYWRAYSDVCGADMVNEATINTFYTKPGTVILVEPQGNDISSTGDFEWRAADNADGYTVRYGLAANNLNEELTTTSTSVAYNGLAASTTYYWNVTPYQINLAGDMVEGTASATWNFTTVALSAPTMISPLADATNEMLDILFQWVDFPNALYYGLEISSDDDLHVDGLFEDRDDVLVSHPDENNRVEGTKFMLDNQLDYGKTYYYHIRTAVADGNNGVKWSAWSPVMEFTTIPAGTPVPVAGDDDNSVCAASTFNTVTYETPAIDGVNYVWTVSNGGEIDSQNGNQCVVTWDESGNQVVSVERSSNDWQEWDNLNNQWVPFIDNGVNNDVVVTQPGEMPVTLEYYDYRETHGAPYCVNEKITLKATINDATNFVAATDVFEKYWLVEDVDESGDPVTHKFEDAAMVMDYDWAVPGDYDVTFYAVSIESECLQISDTKTISILGTCDIHVELAEDIIGTCAGTGSTQIQSYVYGGDGSAYEYVWTPASKFANSTSTPQDNAIGELKNTYRDVTFKLAVTNQTNQYGEVTETTTLAYKPYPSLNRVVLIPNLGVAGKFELNNDGQYKIIKDWDHKTDASGSIVARNTAVWQKANRDTLPTDPEVELAKGMNRFYLSMVNSEGDCWNGPNAIIVYQRPFKNSAENEYTVGVNGTAIMNSYPNPCTTNLNVEAEFVDPTSATVSVVNIEGKTLKTFNTVNGTKLNQSYNVADLTAGTYFLVLTTNDDTIVWKFIKQ
jgi:hypothetical protein